MDKDQMKRAAGVFATSYIKRWMEGPYDALLNLPVFIKLKALGPNKKYFIETCLYVLTAYADYKLSEDSFAGKIAKDIIVDAGPEIASRLLKDVRMDLNQVSTINGAQSLSVASKLLELDDDALLRILTYIEDLDEIKHEKFMDFVAKSSKEELEKFSLLSLEQRNTILSIHNVENTKKDLGWKDTLKSFFKDVVSILKIGKNKVTDVSIKYLKPLLERYLGYLMWTLKMSGVMLGVGILACIAGTTSKDWILFWMLIILLVLSLVLIYVGKKFNKGWLVISGIISAATMLLLSFMSASGYNDSIFAISIFILIGLPIVLMIFMLILITMLFEILHNLLPGVYKTFMVPFQWLFTVFAGVIFFAVFLLVIPPQNPVAIIFIIPIMILVAALFGFGIVRINPEVFLNRYVIIGVVAILIVLLGLMSMPNLRYKIRTLAKNIDRHVVANPPSLINYNSSKDIEFMTADGEIKLWYAERQDGGYDLFVCDGVVGPYYAKDGRQLKKTDSDLIRKKISDWVDQIASKNAEVIYKQNLINDAEKVKDEAAKKIQAEKDRIGGYLNITKLPKKVEYILCVSAKSREFSENFSEKLTMKLNNFGKTVFNGIFTEDFVNDGGFEKFAIGKGASDIHVLSLSKMSEKLLLAKFNRVSTKTAITQSFLVYTASLTMTFSIINTSNGEVIDRFQISDQGAGSNEEYAIKQASDEIMNKLITKL